MQFVYANADRKWGDLQQPIWLSLRANCVWQIWWSSMMTLQETVDEEVASTWTWAKHLMLSCKTSLSLSGEAGIWPIQHLVDKELAGRFQSKELFNIHKQSQLLSLRGQYRHHRCLMYLSVTLSGMTQWQGSRAPSANLPATPSCVGQLTCWKKGMLRRWVHVKLQIQQDQVQGPAYWLG